MRACVVAISAVLLWLAGSGVAGAIVVRHCGTVEDPLPAQVRAMGVRCHRALRVVHGALAEAQRGHNPFHVHVAGRTWRCRVTAPVDLRCTRHRARVLTHAEQPR